jgi:hypothetical protein
MNNFLINNKSLSGFRMMFDNGYSISVQWGSGTYSSNYDDKSFDKTLSSKTAEVAILYGSEFVPDIIEQNPIGYRTSEEVAALIYKVSLLESRNGKRNQERTEESEEKS